jgi:hypothetical protein
VKNPTGKTNEYKRQHYVPRFYLEYFSSITDGYINIGIIKDRKIVLKANYVNQCYEEYFYGKDLLLEKNLFNKIDGLGSSTLSHIIKTEVLPKRGSENWQILYIYTHLQHLRTMASYDESAAQILDLERHVFKEYLKSKGVPDFDPKLAPANYLSEGMKMILSACADNIIEILDLKCKLLINSTSSDFITSDNPVALVNPYYHGRYNGRTTGLAKSGLQIFFPISPKHAIVFYDSALYEIGERRRKVVHVRSEHDVKWLNRLQHLNARSCVYFQNKEFAETVKESFRADEDVNHPKLNFITLKNGEILIRLAKKELCIKGAPSFCIFSKRRNDELIPAGQIPYRNPEEVYMRKRFDNYVAEGRYQRNEFSRFLDDFEHSKA